MIESGNNIIDIKYYTVTGTSRLISVDILSIFIALIPFGLLLLPFYNRNYEDWSIGQWIFYFIAVVITTTLVGILLSTVYNSA
jgi:hypothetical protein